MSKILLVEDDQNLSEIYNARLSAEGYEVLGAANGEDALAIAAKEKPDLVISDVMMPRVSGFEMLDILRHTDGMQGVKVIMLTALGQDNDRSKASELGADRYLVKSQVTLEDIVNAAKELLGDSAAPAEADDASASEATTPAEPVTTPPAEAATASPVVADSGSTEPATPPLASAPQPSVAAQAEPAAFGAAPTTSDAPSAVDDPSATTTVDDTSDAADASTSPTTDSSVAAATSTEPTSTDMGNEAAGGLASAEPIAEEEAELKQQLNNGPAAEQDPVPAATLPAEPATDINPGFTAAGNDSSEPPAPAPEVGNDSQVAAPSPAESVAEPPVTENTPVETTPADAGTAPASNHDEVLAAALKELEGESSPPPTIPLGDANKTEASTAPTTEPAGTTNDSSNNISGHKVIQPPGATDKPDINQLLAKDTEAAQSPADTSPDQTTPPEAPNNPNNISL